MAKIYGPLLCIASATSSQSMAVCARFCVELDLSKEYRTEVYVGTESDGEFQPVKFENQPLFCNLCRKRGHLESSCGRNPEKKTLAPSHVYETHRVNHKNTSGNA